MKTVIIGRFGKVFGLKGWITVHSYTDPQINILDYTPWLIKHPNQEEKETLVITQGREHGKAIVIKLPTCDDPDQARMYTNLDIAVDRDVLPEIAEDDKYYWADLEGLTVKNLDNISFGKLAYVTNTGANDIIVVKDEATNRERWLPYIDDVIKNVDLKQGIITVDWDKDF